MTQDTLSRRRFLAQSMALGCTAAASPLLTPVTLASAPWDNRLVVIILRGGMDGIGVVQPYGAPEFAGLRGFINGVPVDQADGLSDLDGFFALHPALSRLMPLWQRGELGFVHAVSTPYRDKRSHFDGQDLLEAGTSALDGTGARDGWLNRMLQVVPGLEAETAYAIGRADMQLLSGAAPVANWSPDAALSLSPQAQELVALVMREDPLFAAAFEEAVALSQSEANGAGMAENDAMMGGEMMAGKPKRQRNLGHIKLAEFAAEKLRGDTRVAAFSLNGWDTHARQLRTLEPPLKRLSDVILQLKKDLGPVWGKTTVMAMTEFGRTARMNGTGGTDHGTAGAVVMAGGALRGGKVYGQWPGLDRASLYAGRDLMPTRDVRAHAAWVMRGLFGLSTDVLERSIFPDLEMGANTGVLL